MNRAPEPDALALRAAVTCGEQSVRETIDAALERFEAWEGELISCSAVHADAARSRADELDDAFRRGAEPGPLFGVPLILKANMCVAGVETNCGSKILAGYRPPYTATFVKRAIAAGCVPIATAHMDEFAMGSSGENSAYASTRNPWDTRRTPGGSSSGCAAAVAAGLAPLALGSDTGGSVRQPAAFSGVSGFKPTFGRISRYGLVAFGSSFDQVSPLARSVRDIECMLLVLAGRDPLDATSLPVDSAARVDTERFDGVTFGVPRELFESGLDADVGTRIEAAIETLESLGAQRVDVSLPLLTHALATYYVVVAAEASSNLARFDGVRYGARQAADASLHGMIAATRNEGFGDEVKRRILLGTYVLQAGYQDEWYKRALSVRELLRRQFAVVFGKVDLLVAPTAPTPAFRLGERVQDPLAMYASDALTVPASLAGLPAVSVPCGFVTRDGSELPIGLQIMGRARDDARVLWAARLYQDATTHHRVAPDLSRVAL